MIQLAALSKDDLQLILQRNNEHIERFRLSPLMQLIVSTDMQNKTARIRLLDCIQVFSNYFQRTVMLRHIFCNNDKFFPATVEHLQEEFGHNIALMEDRNNHPPIWDPILEATSSWFTWQMFTLDSEEKTLLVHLVLETSAYLFFQEAHKVMSAYNETNYFQVHSEADEKHEKMGTVLLDNLTAEKYMRLLEIQKQGWDMLNTVCARIAALTIQNI